MAITSLTKMVVYRRTDDRELVELGTPTPQLGAGSSGSALGVPIGFEFRFDGSTFTTIDLFAFGFARLAGSESSSNNTNLFVANNSELLAPWWDQLETAASVGYLKTEVQGVAPRRRFVAEWYCHLAPGYTVTDHVRARFQLVLEERADRIAFRYGPLELAGAPVVSSSATVAIKGDTTVDAANRLNFVVDDRALGASSSSATLALLANWPVWTSVAEPAWPMTGHLELTDFEDLAGLQDKYADPAWSFAAAVNWLICNFCPAWVNFTPWQETHYQEVSYPVPIEPSEDGLTYQVLVQTYTSLGGDLSIVIDQDNGSAAQIDQDYDWTTLVTSDVLGTSAGWHEWPVFEVTPSVEARCLRITVLHLNITSNLILGPVRIRNKPLADIDPEVEYPSGVMPMSIAQIRQQGGAIHPEFYNRAWSTLAALLRSRRQMVWSSIWPDIGKVQLEATASKPWRMVGVSWAHLGQSGQRVTVRTYARSELAGAKLVVGEEGGSGITFDVDTAGYRIDESELQLVSSLPQLSCIAKPSGELSPMAVVVQWSPELGTAPLIQGVTPAPRLEYLVRLAQRIEYAFKAYAMTGIATALCRGKSTTNPTRVLFEVPPATQHLRPVITRVTTDSSQGADDTTIVGVSSGLFASDKVVITSQQTRGRDDYPPEGSVTQLVGAEVFEASPLAQMDRLLESPTAGSMEGSRAEWLEVVRGVGITLIPKQIAVAE